MAAGLSLLASRTAAAEDTGPFPRATAGASIARPSPVSAWMIESADYHGEIAGQIVRLEARYTIRLIQDGWVQIPLGIEGATITDVQLEKKSGEAHLVPQGGAYTLAASRKGVYKIRVSFSTRLTQDSQSEGVAFRIPQATFSTMTLTVPRKEVTLRPADQLYVDVRPAGPEGGVRLTARLGAGEHVDLRWATEPAAPVKLIPLIPVVYGEVKTLVTLEDQLALLTSLIDYRIAQGETKAFQIQVPSSLTISRIRGANIEDWHLTETGQDKLLTVTLATPLKDVTYRLIVEAEATRDTKASSFSVPALQLLGVKQERGYLAVGRTGNIEVSPESSTGVTRIDVRELPEAFASVSATPAVLGFRYQQHPYTMVLSVIRHQDHPVLSAIVEHAHLATVFSRQGEAISRAAYIVKANKQQFLQVTLPEQATLWSCIVAGESVKPVEGTGGALLVPLPGSYDSSQPVPVELVYFEHRPTFTGVGTLRLEGPSLDAPVTIANWTLYMPGGVRFLRVGGNLERGTAPAEFLADPFQSPPELAAAVDTAGAMRKERYAAHLERLQRIERAFQVSRDSSNEDGQLILRQSVHNKTGKGAAPQTELGQADPSLVSRPVPDAKGLEEFERSLQETGVMPLKIQLPKSGTAYHFNRLITTQDALALEGTFVHLRIPSWLLLAAVGLVIAPLGVAGVGRFFVRL
ncbi:MAG: hypothetical protein A3C53_03900 [Omnitrophica WOR_2 bacterium RIFCSPHIGHO2_02_FULL_68_15]|nr:MAG: hypothetical protein A3C53_03900 [Omnitrophica WOR_2 bacterium RIFCSPHIGHO2_02_FULL_68_15]